MAAESAHIPCSELHFNINDIGKVKACVKELKEATIVPFVDVRIKPVNHEMQKNNLSLMGVYYIVTIDFESDEDCFFFDKHLTCRSIYKKYNTVGD
jgi:hypothetical protein